MRKHKKSDSNLKFCNKMSALFCVNHVNGFWKHNSESDVFLICYVLFSSWMVGGFPLSWSCSAKSRLFLEWSACWTSTSVTTASSTWWTSRPPARTSSTSSQRTGSLKSSWPETSSGKSSRPSSPATPRASSTGTSRTRTSWLTWGPSTLSSSTLGPEPTWKTESTPTLTVSHFQMLTSILTMLSSAKVYHSKDLKSSKRSKQQLWCKKKHPVFYFASKDAFTLSQT